MKHFVEECKRLFLKFKEKEIECEGLKEEIKGLQEKRKKGSSIRGVKEMMVRIGYLEDEYKRMESEERGKCAQLSLEIEGFKSEKKRADDEIHVLKVRCKELEVHGRLLLNQKVEMGRELEECKAKYDCLLVQLNQRVELEGKLRETIKNLEEENKKMEMDRREKCVKLEESKKRADDKCGVLEGIGMELEVQATVSLNYAKELATACSGMQERISALINERNAASEREKTAKEKVAYLEEVVKEMESRMNKFTEPETRVLRMEGENQSLRGLQNEVCCSKTDGTVNVANVLHPKLTDNVKDEHFPEPHYNQWEPSANSTDEKKNVCSGFKVESVIAVEQQITLDTEENLRDSLVLLKQCSVNTLPTDVIEIDSEDEVIEVINTEDEKEIIGTHPCKELLLLSTDETLNASEKCLKRPLSLQRDEAYEASCDTVSLTPWSRLCSTSKRSRASETTIGQSVSQKED
ncbi:hypothetical protein MKW92_047286 [Papaver armeniacum]|nr:hypothetical protein MKW92_047286 [Papaver armeniacum]